MEAEQEFLRELGGGRGRPLPSFPLLFRLGKRGQKVFLRQQVRHHIRKRTEISRLVASSVASYHRLNQRDPWELTAREFKREVLEPVAGALECDLVLDRALLDRRVISVTAWGRCRTPVVVAALWTLQNHNRQGRSLAAIEERAISLAHPDPRETRGLNHAWHFGLKWIIRRFVYPLEN